MKIVNYRLLVSGCLIALFFPLLTFAISDKAVSMLSDAGSILSAIGLSEVISGSSTMLANDVHLTVSEVKRRRENIYLTLDNGHAKPVLVKMPPNALDRIHLKRGQNVDLVKRSGGYGFYLKEQLFAFVPNKASKSQLHTRRL
jgi:hypothetical protein